MTVHLVEISDEDTFLAVTNYISNLLNDGQPKTALAETPGSRFAADCRNLLDEGKTEQFITRLVSQVDVVYSKANEKDAETCSNVMIHLVSKLETSQVVSAALQVGKAIAKNPQERGAEKLQALLSLYANCPTAASQYVVLVVTVEFAKANKALAQVLLPSLKGKAEEWVKAWKLPDLQARDLFLALASFMKVVGDKASTRESLKLLTLALSLTRGDDAKGLAEVKPYAIQAAQEFIRAPDIFQCDLFTLPAVQQLEKDAAQGGLYKLLSAMLAGDLAAFKAAASGALLEQVGVGPDAAIAKMRTMALLALANSAAHDWVSYDQVKAALDIPESQVESWVVLAIGRKLLEAKMDQPGRRLAISRATQATFGPPEWARLKQQLAAWKDSMAGVVAMAAQHKAAAAPRGVPARA